MFLFGRKQLGIREFDKTSIATPKKRMKEVYPSKTGSISFTSIKLHVAISRAILSRDLSNLDLLFDAASSFLRYRTLVNSKSGNMKLNKESFEALRDFSQKARLGELAQGITMLFSQEYLEHPIVVDFYGFISKRNPRATIKGLTPDYIIQKDSDLNISIIESKGHYSLNGSTKGKLSKGLRQCSNGATILKKSLPSYAIQKSFGVCLKLFNETEVKKESEIQFVDPAEEESNNNSNIEVMQYHYASWFLLMGNLGLYDRLINNELITQKDISPSSVREYLGKTFIFFDHSDLLIRIPYHLHFLVPPYIREYGIQKEVIDILMGKALRLSQVNFKVESVEDQAKGITYFHDGTILIHSENPLW